MTAETPISSGRAMVSLDFGMREYWLLMADAVLATHGKACRAGDSPVLCLPEERRFVLELIASLHEQSAIPQAETERLLAIVRRLRESRHLVAPDPRRISTILKAIEHAARVAPPGEEGGPGRAPVAEPPKPPGCRAP